MSDDAAVNISDQGNNRVAIPAELVDEVGEGLLAERRLIHIPDDGEVCRRLGTYFDR
jgi:hypothetical protein